MRARRFNTLHSLVVTAALGAVAALSGPSSAQHDVEARTGAIHDDCDRFTVTKSAGAACRAAYCRTSDDNDNRDQTTIGLHDDIATTTDGRLTWYDAGGFHDHCDYLRVEQHGRGVTLKASCRNYLEQEGAKGSKRATTLELADHYQVNTSGKLEVK